VTRERRIDLATSAMFDTTYSYDPAGRLLATDGPLPGAADTSYNRYDAVGQLTGTISPDPDGAGTGNPMLAVRNSYDQAGRLIKVETGTLASLPPTEVAPADWPGFTPASSAETQCAQNRKIRAFVREGPSPGSGQAGPVRALTEYSYDSRGRLDCTATRASVASSAPALTHKARQEGGPPSSAAETVASSAIMRRIRHRSGRWNGGEGPFGPLCHSVRRS
jgi:hypothetical protein